MSIIDLLSQYGEKIAVVELYGTIGRQIKSSQYEQLLSKLKKDTTTRAIVLDIDSPGGGVSESDYLYRSILKIAESKPVIASIRGLGASGAYYIACACTAIVAAPSSIIGSIGVISVRPALQELLQRTGIGVRVNKSGKFKDMGAFWRDSSVEEEEKMQSLIDESYESFVEIVSQARGMEKERVKELATGEVFWASKAHQLGLVDGIGDLDYSIDIAAKIADAPRRPVVMRPQRSIFQTLVNPAAALLVDSVIDTIESRIADNRIKY